MDAIPLCDITKAYTDIYVNTQLLLNTILFCTWRHVSAAHTAIFRPAYNRTRPFMCAQYGIPHCLHTGCPRRNVPDVGTVFLMLKYTDITQNTSVQSWTVTEIMAWEKCGLLAGPRTVPVSWQPYPCPSLSVFSYYGNSAHTRSKLFMYFLLGDKAVQFSAWHSCHV